MTEAGFATDLDVNLDLTADDVEPCMIDECEREAVMNGVITTPCGHDQPLCLHDYERNVPRWEPGDVIWCYRCRPMTRDTAGEFVRWEKIKR